MIEYEVVIYTNLPADDFFLEMCAFCTGLAPTEGYYFDNSNFYRNAQSKVWIEKLAKEFPENNWDEDERSFLDAMYSNMHCPSSCEANAVILHFNEIPTVRMMEIINERSLDFVKIHREHSKQELEILNIRLFEVEHVKNMTEIQIDSNNEMTYKNE